MRFNIISETSDGLGFAKRLVDEGEDVRMFIRSVEAKSVGDGIVPKVGDLEDLLYDAEEENDIFIFDTSGNGAVAEYISSLGFPVLGSSLIADRLERDRDYGSQVMVDCEIEVPNTESFDSFEDGRKFVEEHSEDRWVYKPSKQLGDLSPSHVSYDAEDLIEMLSNIENEVDIDKPQFELQKFEKGLAVSSELWFDRGELVRPLNNHTFERKQLMNGDIGPSGGCTGNICWFCEGCRLCDEAMKLVPWAKENDYHGMLDLNVICSEATPKIYGLEFTPRFGYDASPTLFWELVRGPLGRFFADFAQGGVGELDLREGYGGGVRITIPPWPSEKFSAEAGVPIRGYDERLKHSYLYNVKSEDDKLATAGAWGIVMLFTSRGKTISSALAHSNEACETVRVKNKQYRTDLVEQFEDDETQLKNFLG